MEENMYDHYEEDDDEVDEGWVEDVPGQSASASAADAPDGQSGDAQAAGVGNANQKDASGERDDGNKAETDEESKVRKPIHANKAPHDAKASQTSRTGHSSRNSIYSKLSRAARARKIARAKQAAKDRQAARDEQDAGTTSNESTSHQSHTATRTRTVSAGLARTAGTAHRTVGGRHSAAQAAAIRENQKMILIFCDIVAVVGTLLIGLLAMSLPVIPVCAVIVIEVAMAFCLHDVPLWLHAAACLVEIIIGAVCGVVVFTLLGAVIYVLTILSPRVLGRQDK